MLIKIGDSIRVKDDSFTRRNQYGKVVDIFGNGEVAVDFFCDYRGTPFGVPSIEAWKVNELDWQCR